jgi:CheY-like chemotaxis protein
MNTMTCDSLVMIVEDDRDLRESITEVLEDNEYCPIAAANGKEAMEQLKSSSEKPCVILLDIMMPVMDGWQFRAAQERDPELSEIPVIVLTAHGNIEEAESGMHPAACLKKPVALEVLLGTVEQFCRKN